MGESRRVYYIDLTDMAHRLLVAEGKAEARPEKRKERKHKKKHKRRYLNLAAKDSSDGHMCIIEQMRFWLTNRFSASRLHAIYR